MKNFLRVWISI